MNLEACAVESENKPRLGDSWGLEQRIASHKVKTSHEPSRGCSRSEGWTAWTDVHCLGRINMTARSCGEFRDILAIFRLPPNQPLPLSLSWFSAATRNMVVGIVSRPSKDCACLTFESCRERRRRRRRKEGEREREGGEEGKKANINIVSEPPLVDH